MNGIFKIDLNVLRRGDKTIWGVVALLLGFALLGVISTSTISEVKSISSVFLIFARDVLVGVVAMLAACWLDYRCYRGITWIALVLSIAGLAWAFLSGTRWISLFGASLQPSAFALIAMVMFTARYLEKYNRGKHAFVETADIRSVGTCTRHGFSYNVLQFVHRAYIHVYVLRSVADRALPG